MTSMTLSTRRQKRALPLGALLIGGSLATAIGLGAGGLGTATHFYYKLSMDISSYIDKVVDSLLALQTQITSLARVALQNRRALDLLTAEKGGMCQFLGEECCFFVNASGIVQNKVRELKESVKKRLSEAEAYDLFNWWKTSWGKWLIPLLGPLTALMLILTLGPCIINRILNLVKEKIRTIQLIVMWSQYHYLATEEESAHD
ncbi:PREDICTED: HERV-W_7q21.2 provirus ancestral Env polyprotein-like [Elephantulus edwardii]|uniref:HERV-W_7q21.2 provirus ancestral Env polyprotein-like n=1 Tax=Elephantulus edwardii TaxID=28737 RepID=UPI0003F073B6|nr:PREDICTED: HERV-W_7q21.2 provirus ancestral Env polyprotein-like [Elephantulus edwardii]